MKNVLTPYIFNGHGVCQNPKRVTIHHEARLIQGISKPDYCVILVCHDEKGYWYSGVDNRCNNGSVIFHPAKTRSPNRDEDSAFAAGCTATLAWIKQLIEQQLDPVSVFQHYSDEVHRKMISFLPPTLFQDYE